MAGSAKHAVEGLISDPSRISVAIRNDRTVTGHLLNELRNRADPEAAFALKETYLAILDIVLDGPKPSYHKWKGKVCPQYGLKATAGRCTDYGLQEQLQRLWT